MMCNGSKLASVQVGVSSALGQDVSEGLRSFVQVHPNSGHILEVLTSHGSAFSRGL